VILISLLSDVVDEVRETYYDNFDFEDEEIIFNCCAASKFYDLYFRDRDVKYAKKKLVDILKSKHSILLDRALNNCTDTNVPRAVALNKAELYECALLELALDMASCFAQECWIQKRLNYKAAYEIATEPLAHLLQFVLLDQKTPESKKAFADFFYEYIPRFIERNKIYKPRPDNPHDDKIFYSARSLR